MATEDPNKLGLELCKMFGVDPSDVSKISVVCKGGEFPVIEIEKLAYKEGKQQGILEAVNLHGYLMKKKADPAG